MAHAYLFPGQGSQAPGMGEDLFADFAGLVAEADEILGYPVTDLCREHGPRLRQTEYVQPALYVVNALTYLRHRETAGPADLLAGHSLGEYSALFAAGCFDFGTGLRLVRLRGEAMARCQGGGMMAVLGISRERLEELIAGAGIDEIDVANHNTPEQLVVAGPRAATRRLADVISAGGTGKSVPLNVSIAAHSRWMRPAAEELRAALAGVRFAEPSTPVLANVTARPHRLDTLPETLIRHLTEPVRWWDTMCELARAGVDEVTELGPGHVLQKMWTTVRPALPSPAPRATPAAEPVDRVVVLSAAGPGQLRRYAQLLGERLAEPDLDRAGALADVAHTLQTGRVALPHRLAVLAPDLPRVRAALGAFAGGTADPALFVGGADATDGLPDVVADWLAGRDVDWARLRTGAAGRVSLPTHPWDDRAPAPTGPAPQDGPPDAHAAAERYLVARYAEASGLDPADVDAHMPLEELGLSSFVVTRINARLSEDLGESDRTLFFTHTDLAGVADDLVRNDPARWGPAVSGPAEAAAPRPVDDGAAEPVAVAVVGLAGRYPHAENLDQFWQNLAEGRDCVTGLPPHRADAAWPVELMQGGFLDDVAGFDPLLFGLTPRDADLMDPQERLFLEVVWEALEDAGYNRARLRDRHASRVAVFAGAMHNEYPYFGVEQSLDGDRVDSGATLGGIANRVSFHFDLHGPSLSVDTMCSSSLTAIHLAIRALRAGEAEMAIAGGVNLSLHPNKFVQQHRMRLDATDRRCRSFGEGGDGFVPAEGAGVVVLKRLDRALADGDRIHAVLRGSAVVHAGRTNGYLVPNPDAQGEMVVAALRDAGVDPAGIGYLEAHGAGTALGDPVEIKGLLHAFGDLGLAPGAIPIGSVKSTIGHVESAAGIAGLTKVILQLRHGELAPSLHTERLNPNIAWSEVPFAVQRARGPWPAPAGAPRRAGISSFGAGGTIAHLVVEDRPAPRPVPAVAGPQVVVLSAYDDERLAELVDRHLRFLATERPALPDLAHTLQVGREPLRQRLATVVDDLDQLRARLTAFRAGTAEPEVLHGRTAGGGLADGPVLDAGADPHELARHWTAGGRVDWERRSGDRPAVVPLPTYPFARLRCWLPAASAEVPDRAEIPLLERGWAPAPAPSTVDAGTGPVVCLFAPHSEPVAAAVAGLLGADRVLLVREGGDLDERTRSLVTEADAVSLAATLLREHPDLAGWLDLTDLHRPGTERGLWQARLRLLQELLGARRELRVLHVVSGLQALPGDERDPQSPPGDEPGPSGARMPGPAGARMPGLAGARMAAFVRVLGAERPGLHATVLDTDLPAGRPADLARHIADEWAITDGFGEICRRRDVRHRPVLRPVDAPYRALRPDPDAAYVVTGGTRGLGALVARFLAERGARHLALTGLRPVDADRDPGIAHLRALGAEVTVHTGPLTDPQRLGAFLDRVRARAGRIDGIVHCAGRSSQGPAPFARLDPETTRAVLEPKADALDVLTDLTAADRPSFAVLFSSVCAAVPAVGAGVADYAAANGYADLTAAHLARTGRPWFRSVNWPQWTQSGGGRDKPNPCLGVGIGTLDDAAGLRVLERVLALPNGTAVLPAPPLDGTGTPVDLDALPALRPAAAEPAVVAETAGHRPATPTTTPSAGPAGWLVELFARELRIPPERLDTTATFGDLGVESIMLGDLVRAIEDRLDRPMEPSLLLEHPTLEQLSAHLGLDEPSTAPAEPAAAPPAVVAPDDRRIAVVGLACRFPGAPDAETFWQNLLDGRCTVREVPAERWDHHRHYAPELTPGRSISKWGGFVEGIEDFDPEYFNLSDGEATALDPAIRMFLESTATAVRHAGYGDGDLKGQDVGVFVGARMSDYGRRVPVGPAVLRSDQNFIAAHVAHHFDFRGPNLVVDSACSSSLVAVQLAMRSLLAGESTVAVAGGVEVLLDEQPYIDLSAARALSPSGRCRTFDRAADGFVPGEGCGVVVLKPLAAAVADGDEVYAVIDAVAVNNDGRTMGITTPNPKAQAQVVQRALRAAGRSPDEVGMVEAHGTGTLIGDPIELRALTDVYGHDTDRTGWCPIGSVKSNVGHLLSAAGMAGLLKVVLALRHGRIPATLFCDEPNPRFDFGRSPFVPNTATRAWDREPAARVAALSSFGLGGTNAHLVASGFTAPPRAEGPRRSPLPPPAFRRRRLWLDPPEPPRPVPAGEVPMVASILDFQLTTASH